MRRKTLALSMLALGIFILFPAVSMAGVDVKNNCPIDLDSNTSEWADIASLVTDASDTVGTTYYWVDDAWTTTEPDSYEYSTNVAQMADLENIKMCNDATTMYLYVDAQHPMFGIYDMADEKFIEFPDSTDMGMPEEFNYWMVYEIQKKNKTKTLFYGIHLYSAVGDAGLESGPTKEALYEDDGDGVFNPNLDEELVEFNSDENRDESEEDTKGGKEFDQNGALEVGLDLINSDGEGLFTETKIDYGDTLNVSVSMYPNSSFASSVASSGLSSVEETDTFEYVLTKAGVENLRTYSKKKHRTTIKFRKVPGATKYIVKKYLGSKYKNTYRVTNNQKLLKGLKSNKTYKVKVRAKVGSVYTPYMSLNFKTKK